MKRNKIEILTWMMRHGIKQVHITEALRLQSKTIVNETIAGKRHNRRVLQWLKRKGCPEKYLALPDDMRRAA